MPDSLFFNYIARHNLAATRGPFAAFADNKYILKYLSLLVFVTVTNIKQEKTNQDRTKIGPFFDFFYILYFEHNFTTEL